MKPSLPPGKLAVCRDAALLCFRHAEATGPESPLLAAEGPCAAAPALPNSSVPAPSGRADRGRKTAVALLEKTEGDPLIRSNSPSLWTTELKSSLHAELVFASRLPIEEN